MFPFGQRSKMTKVENGYFCLVDEENYRIVGEEPNRFRSVSACSEAWILSFNQLIHSHLVLVLIMMEISLSPIRLSIDFRNLFS